ncbi:MAG TPA: LytTR family DNA-binding domain-containing protein [Opitutaceae bacterium]|nr:LytTR family DNA-binding domain-containing protein [Opitutaceae bacterium]
MNPNPSSSPATSPGRIRAVIVDDEPAARRGVRLLLERDRSVDVVGEASNGPEAVELMTQEKPDLVFLDVQMPGCDGFAALAQVDPASVPAVIFVTAYDEHALRAFEINAVDYLLKPYDDARFTAALERAKEEMRRRTADSVNLRLTQLLTYLEGDRAGPAKGSEHFLIKSAGEIFFLKADEIDWVEAEGDYMKFHVSGRALLMRETMARLEARLDPRRFIRIHRSTIVNLDRLRKLSPTFAGDYTVILHDGTKLKLSRGYHDRIAALLKKAL